MTIDDLILKLQSEKDNGVYAVLRAWMSNIKKLCKEAEDEKDPKHWLWINDRKEKEYSTCFGFVWGLAAADYISVAERKELLDELREAVRG